MEFYILPFVYPKYHYSKSWSSLPDAQKLRGTLPRALNKECIVRTVEEDPEVLKARQATLKDKSISDLAQIKSLSDIPIPDTVENLFSKNKPKNEERSR